MFEKIRMDQINIIPCGFEQQSVIDGAAYGVSGYLHQASFVELDNHDILIACGGNKVPGDYGGDYGGCWTYLWRSTDGGKTFDEVTTPYKNNAVSDLCTSNPTLLKLDDRLVMMSRNAGTDASEGITYILFSFDNGTTWGSNIPDANDWVWKEIIIYDPVKGDTIPSTGDKGFNQWGPCCFSCRPKLLKDGSIILSLCASWMEEPPSTTRHGNYFFVSKDNGITWSYLGGMKRPPTGEVICEPAVLELPDGRLFSVIRSYNTILPEEDGSLTYKGSRYYYFSVSSDSGKTWSEPWPTYLGSERWNGAMSDIALVNDTVYLLGTFSQYHPADTSGLAAKIWPDGAQRNPLMLLEIPLKEVMNIGKGTPILYPTAVRPVGNNLTEDPYLGGCFASVQLEAMENGELGVLCDTHTRGFDENKILFWRMKPEWVRETKFALFRGPVPYLEQDGSIRVLNSRTTIKTVNFPSGHFPVEIEATIKAHRLVRKEITSHPLITIYNQAELIVPATSYSKSIFTSVDILTCHPKDGLCRFVLNTGEGQIVTGRTINTEVEYKVKIVIQSRFKVILYINDEKILESIPVSPAVPGGFTIGHGEWPATPLDISFKDISVSHGKETINHLEHPFIIDVFEETGKQNSGWIGNLENLTLVKRGESWVLSLPAKPWANWLKFGGMVIECQDENQASNSILKINLDGKEYLKFYFNNEFLNMQIGEKSIKVSASEKHCYAISSSALHERTYIVSSNGASKGIVKPFIDDNVEGQIEMILNQAVKKCIVLAWDFPASSGLRYLETL